MIEICVGEHTGSSPRSSCLLRVVAMQIKSYVIRNKINLQLNIVVCKHLQ